MAYVEVGAWSDVDPPAGAVVCGYNGRDPSRAALTWGAGEAARRGAPLVVLFAANYPGMALGPGPGLLHREPDALAAAEEVTAAGVTEALDIRPGLWVLGATEVAGPFRALVEASRRASVVVLGNRRHGRVASALLGSVSFAVSARAECPVVVVTEESLDRSPGARHRVVVGTDGSPEASAAVAVAAHRAVTTSAILEIIACTGGQPAGDADQHELLVTTGRIATSTADHVRATHPELAVRTRVEDRPAEVALIEASAAADLVVVGTRGRGAFEGMMLGSVSQAVLNDARCPVAVVGRGQH
jgi:nucleotide-binding universal stress UspA family protein